MDSWRVEPFPDHRIGLAAEIARFGAAGLSLRLTSLRQQLERDFPLTLALDLTDRDAVDGLSPELTAAIHAILQEAALAVAKAGAATLVRLAIHVGENSVLLRIEDDGAAAFTGIYDLAGLLAFGVGPQSLAQRVAAHGGRLKLDARVDGSRIEIALSRDAATSTEAISLPAPALAAAS